MLPPPPFADKEVVDNENITVFKTKLAVTAESAFIVNEQVPVRLLQTIAFPVPPVQLWKLDPFCGVPFRTSAVPALYSAAHVLNVTPPSVLQVTEPFPVTEVVNVCGGGRLNVAVIAESPLTVNVQGPVPLQPAALPVPALQPAKPPPTAVSVTAFPFTNVFEQVAEQLLMPVGVEETVPVPVPAKLTVIVENVLVKCVSA